MNFAKMKKADRAELLQQVNDTIKRQSKPGTPLTEQDLGVSQDQLDQEAFSEKYVAKDKFLGCNIKEV